MTYKLFLDDYRTPEMVTWKRLPSGPWVIVANWTEFKGVVDVRGVPEFVTYDHDLADIHYTGTGQIELSGVECAEYLVGRCRELDIPHPPYEIHSMNPVGAVRIRNTIEDYNRVWHQDHANQ